LTIERKVAELSQRSMNTGAREPPTIWKMAHLALAIDIAWSTLEALSRSDTAALLLGASKMMKQLIRLPRCASVGLSERNL
jgi:hypothetical protein